MDASGGAIPGATVVVKNNGTGATNEAITTTQGAFTFPGLLPGAYTVTVSLEGFKTAILNDVILNAGVISSVTAKLEVGGVTETVTVEGASALVQTVSSSVSSTINTKQIENLPLTSRNVMDFVASLPGVQTAGGIRQSSVNRIIGGWQIHGNARFQSGIWVDFGNVRMVGFDEKGLRDMFKLRINENQRVFMLPQAVIDETVKPRPGFFFRMDGWTPAQRRAVGSDLVDLPSEEPRQ